MQKVFSESEVRLFDKGPPYVHPPKPRTEADKVEFEVEIQACYDRLLLLHFFQASSRRAVELRGTGTNGRTSHRGNLACLCHYGVFGNRGCGRAQQSWGRGFGGD